MQVIGRTAVQFVQFPTAMLQLRMQEKVFVSIEKGAVQLEQLVAEVQLLQLSEQLLQVLAVR